MHVLFQNVLNVCDEVKNQISPYLCGLLFYEGRKTCSAMARGLSVSVKQFYNSFTNACEKIASIRDSLKSSANKMVVANELRVFVIDGTSLVKAFAKKIDHLSVDYDGVTRRVAQGLSLMVASLITSGNVVHLDFLFWLNKKSKKTEKRKRKTKIKTNSMYKTKIDLAIDLILAWKNLVLFHYIALDGAFASEKMISFFGREKLNYSMRIPRSRVVTINGITAKLCNHPALRLVRNGRYASASGFYKNHACFFTVEKKTKWGMGKNLHCEQYESFCKRPCKGICKTLVNR
jgi:hypothetical protein